MKKLLAIFAATGIIATSGISVVACEEGAAASDKEGILKTNPSNEEEVLAMINNVPTISKRIGETTLALMKSDIAEIIAKVGAEGGYKTLSNSEKKSLIASSDWNQMSLDAIIISFIDYKLAQFGMSLSEEDLDSFMEKNSEILSEVIPTGDLKTFVATYKSGEEVLLAALSTEGMDEIVSSKTIKLMEEAITWVKQNNFKKD